MIVKADYIEGVGKCPLYYKTWLPDGEPQAVMAIVHGVGEHLERYRNIVDLLVPHGYLLMAYDQRGHGCSGGQRGHIESWQDFRDDLSSFLALVRQAYPDLPVFLYGHSMGSLVVLDYLMHLQPEWLNGVILSGTAVEPADAAPPVQVFLAKTISGIYPQFALKVKLPGSSLSRDPKACKAYDEDPLVFWQRSARWGTESLKTVAWINQHPELLTLPVLFIHGGQDSLVKAEGAQRLYEQAASADKTLRIYPGVYHEPHNDLDYPVVIGDIEQWMAERL